MRMLSIAIMGTSVLLAAKKASFVNNKQEQQKYPLTFINNVHEVTVHRLSDRSQRVFGLQSVVAIVNVCWVLEDQTAL